MRRKEYIVKTVIVLTCIFGLLATIIIPLLTALFGGDMPESDKSPEPYYTLWIIDLILFFVFGGSLMVLLPRFGLEQKSEKPERTAVPFDSFQDFINFFQKALFDRGYQLQDTVSFLTDAEIRLFIKPLKLWEIECFSVIHVPELSDKEVDAANDTITDILTAYYSGKTITDTVNMTSVFCVERITPTFRKLLNSTMEQGIKNGRLLVGISFGGKNMYISRQNGGFAIGKYRRMRKQLADIMRI